MRYAPPLLVTPSPGTGALANPIRLERYTAALAADVTMTNANTFYDGPTVTIQMGGTYLFVASALINHDAAGSDITVKLWDGTTVYAAAAGRAPVYAQYPLMAIIAVGATPHTYKLSATSTGAAAVFKAAPNANSPGASLTSYIDAVWIGP